MVKELTETEFHSTMISGMTNVTESATPCLDIWPYVNELSLLGIVSDYICKNFLVELVYRNQNNTYDHILLPTANSNEFIVVVVNLSSIKIYGYFKLDLNKGYGVHS